MTGIHQILASSQSSSPLLLDIITDFGLTSNLNLVLDAADLRSYDGSSQTWTDASGGGNNFFRGTTSGADATDPTFNGTAGLATEGTYFSFDGGDYFTETAAHTFADNWHKDNGACSLVFVFYPITGSALFGNSGSGSLDGITVDFTVPLVAFNHATTNIAAESVAGPNITASVWNFVGFAFNEAGPTLQARTNGTATTPTVVATTCTDNNPNPMRIGAYGDASGPMTNTSRLACVALWSTDIGAIALTNIYSRLKALRFTSLP